MLVRIGLKSIFVLIIDPDKLQEGQLFIASIALLFATFRYFMMVLVGIGIYPLLFKKINI